MRQMNCAEFCLETYVVMLTKTFSNEVSVAFNSDKLWRTLYSERVAW